MSFINEHLHQIETFSMSTLSVSAIETLNVFVTVENFEKLENVAIRLLQLGIAILTIRKLLKKEKNADRK